MDKILERWYFSLILVPIAINIITANTALSDFYAKWEITIIGILGITCIILCLELLKSRSQMRSLKAAPNPRDKRIVQELIQTIDVATFEKFIYEQDSWYGYSQSAIKKTTDFTDKALSEEYKTSNEKINELVEQLANTIYDFNSYAGTKLYSEGNRYKPAKENEYNLKITEEATPIMNKQTTRAYNELKELLKYARKNRYLD